MTLADYQARLLSKLTPDSEPSDDPAVAIMNEAIVEWAVVGLTSVCPVVTGLLSFDDRLTVEVRKQLHRRNRPVSIHEWGMAFASRLGADDDPWISWAAQVDAAMLAAADSSRVLGASCPGDPMRAILLIASGSDPRFA